MVVEDSVARTTQIGIEPLVGVGEGVNVRVPDLDGVCVFVGVGLGLGVCVNVRELVCVVVRVGDTVGVTVAVVVIDEDVEPDADALDEIDELVDGLPLWVEKSLLAVCCADPDLDPLEDDETDFDIPGELLIESEDTLVREAMAFVADTQDVPVAVDDSLKTEDPEDVYVDTSEAV